MIKFFKKIKNLKYKNSEKGVALVITLTIVSLLLSLSVSMSNIILRQTRITNINNESKPAFYLADSAMECAIHYDTLEIMEGGVNINKDFDKSIFGKSTEANAKSRIKCGVGSGEPKGLRKINNTDGTVTTIFDIDYGGDQCARVELIRSKIETEIVTRGYNTNAGTNGCNFNNIDKKRLVERGLKATY